MRIIDALHLEDAAGQLAEVGRRLDEWAELARNGDREAFLERVAADIAAAADPETAAVYPQAAPPDQLYAGLARYWRKRAEAASATLS